MDNINVEITDSRKTYPEENMEFKGVINGKKWEGRQTYGTSPFSHAEAVEENVKLTEEEIQAVFKRMINW